MNKFYKLNDILTFFLHHTFIKYLLFSYDVNINICKLLFNAEAAVNLLNRHYKGNRLH